MHFEKIHNKGQARLFKSHYLEMLTKTHPLVIWGMYLPVIVYMLYYSGNSLGFSMQLALYSLFSGVCFSGPFLNTSAIVLFFIWWQKARRAKKFIYTLHGNHHHYPRDRQRLFMPPVPSLILASAIFGHHVSGHAV